MRNSRILTSADEIEKRKGAVLTAIERQQLERRAQAARYWLEHYRQPRGTDRLAGYATERAAELTASQRAFLHQLADRLPGIPQEDKRLAGCVIRHCASRSDRAGPGI